MNNGYDNSTNNNTLFLGVGILILGIVLGNYSISTYRETKVLETKLDYSMIDGNTDLTTTEKYHKYLDISVFLTQKLEQNKNIPIKNASCSYLEYAQHNTKELHKLAMNTPLNDDSMKIASANNVRTMYNLIDSYKTCNNSSLYKSELESLIKEIENRNRLDEYGDMRMREYKSSVMPQEYEQQPELDPIPPEEQNVLPPAQGEKEPLVEGGY